MASPAPRPIEAPAPSPAPSVLPLTDTPEFQAAVAAAAAKAVGELLAKMPVAASDSTGSNQDFARQMALAIAEISDQGTQRKRVAPEILAQRDKARERMIELLVDARAKGLKPEYRVTSMIYLNERIVVPFRQEANKAVPVEIIWPGEPNDAMRPLNDIARAIYREFQASRGSTDAPVDNRVLSLTPGGLVIKGELPNRVIARADEAPFTDQLSIKGETDGADPHDPNADFVHVLGTAADPARQNYQGKTV